MIDKIEVGKKYLDGYGKKVIATAVGENFALYKLVDECGEWNHSVEYVLEHWNEIERETITLTEYVCRYGNIRFLTDDLEFVSCFKFEQKVLKKTLDAEGYKCHKAPNARSYRVYADTLEPVEEGE